MRGCAVPLPRRRVPRALVPVGVPRLGAAAAALAWSWCRVGLVSGRWPAAFAASLRGRRSDVALLAVRRAGRRRGSAECPSTSRTGVRRTPWPDPDGLRVRRPPAGDRLRRRESPRKFSTAALPSAATSVAGAARDLDDELVAALDDDGGAGDAGGVDAVLDDLAGLAHLRRRRRRRALAATARLKITRMPPTRSMPSLGVCRLPGRNTISVEDGEQREQGQEVAPDAQRSGGWCHGEDLLDVQLVMAWRLGVGRRAARRAGRRTV